MLALLTTRIGEVRGQVFLDAELTHAIENRLRLDPIVGHWPIEVETTAGVSTLRGTVPTMTAWGRAGLIAENVPGVRLLLNDLALDAVPRKIDTSVERVVRDTLSRTSIVRPGQVTVEVNDGVAVIRGAVNSWTQHDELMRVVRSRPGINLVRDWTEVRPGASGAGLATPQPPEEAYGADQRTFSRLRAKMADDPYLNRSQVKVSVIDGVAYLYGTVSAVEDRARAESLAALVPGVMSVDNQLAVRR